MKHKMLDVCVFLFFLFVFFIVNFGEKKTKAWKVGCRKKSADKKDKEILTIEMAENCNCFT